MSGNSHHDRNITILGIVIASILAIVTIAVAITIPEIRRALGLDPTATVVPTSETPYIKSTELATQVPGASICDFQLAETGVTNNVDWTPCVKEINKVMMALVPAGCFEMGSTDAQVDYAVELRSGANKSWFEDEQRAHKVCFAKPFWMDETEVTNDQFAEFEGWAEEPSLWTDAQRPRVQISWAEARAFCQRRGMRLPSEAEWEYAARGPDALVFPWGDTWDGSLAVWNTSEVAPVRSKPDNSTSWIGAYDLSGNAREWVADWYAATYYRELEDGENNPPGPNDGDERVVRGGSWSDTQANSLRATDRYRKPPETRYNNFGFRCALSYQP